MTQVDVSAFPKFGNLIGSSGLAGIFDGSTATLGYTEGTLGWVGVNFSSAPQKVGKVEVVSAGNGFDASGQTSQVRIHVRAKNGTAPTTPTDGVAIGVADWFTDQNVMRTVTIESNDAVTEWDHVWVVVWTGVWVILAEVRIFGDAGLPPLKAYDTANGGSHRRACNEPVKLGYGSTELSLIRIGFELREPRVVHVDLHMGFKHSGFSYNGTQVFTGVVGVSCCIIRRSASTRAGLSSAPWGYDKNEVSGGNILNLPQHYLPVSIVGAKTLPAGFYEYSVWAGCHTDALPLNNSSHYGVVEVLAEGNGPYEGRNNFRVEVKPQGWTLDDL